jgi:hypothetical protein
MFSQTMVAAIDAARTLTQLDHLSTDIWKAWGAGQIGDEAQLLAMQLEARRKAVRGDLKPVGIPPGRSSIFPPRRSQRAPVRPVAIARRRRLAASGPMPPGLACKFTVAELAVLRIVGDEVRGQGACAQTIDEIAARAGTCRRMVQNAIRQAAALGLLTVQERRREGQRNLPNVLRVVSREWLSWLRIGCKKIHPTDNKEEKKARPIGRKELPIKEVPATHGSNRSQPARDDEGGVNEKRSPRLVLTQTPPDGERP